MNQFFEKNQRGFSHAFEYNTDSEISNNKSKIFLDFRKQSVSVPQQALKHLQQLGYAIGETVWIATTKNSEQLTFSATLQKHNFSLQKSKKVNEQGGRELVGRVYADGSKLLSKMAADGWEIFVYPNRHKNGVTKIHTAAPTSIFFECDNRSLQEQQELINNLIVAGLQPSAIVYSGNKSLHVYYTIAGECTHQLWAELQKRIIAATNSDVAINNLNRRMRLAGFPRVNKLPQQLVYTSLQVYAADKLFEILNGFFPHGLTNERWQDYLAARRKNQDSESILSMTEGTLPSVVRKQQQQKPRVQSLNSFSTSYADALATINKAGTEADFSALGVTSYKSDNYARCSCPVHKSAGKGQSAYLKHNRDGNLALGCHKCNFGLLTLTKLEQMLAYGHTDALQGSDFISFVENLAHKYGVIINRVEYNRSTTPIKVKLNTDGVGDLPLTPDTEQLQALKNQKIDVEIGAVSSPIKQKEIDAALTKYRDAGVKIAVNGRDFNLVETDYLRKVSMKPTVELWQRYLPEGCTDLEKWISAEMLLIISGTGSGKTESLKTLITQAIAAGYTIKALTHRRNLAGELSRRLQLPYISEYGNLQGNLVGVVDSFHPEGKLDTPLPEKGILIIDEIEQFLIHAVDSSTDVKKHRVAVFEKLAQFIKHCKLVGLDAHMTDLTINFLKEIKGVESTDIHLIKNHYKQSWETYVYNDASPVGLLGNFFNKVAELVAGKLENSKLLFLTDSQEVDSQTGTKNLTTLLQEKYQINPLRIDRETIGGYSPTELIEAIKAAPVTICSPSIATGWDLNLVNMFDSVWGCFNGVLTVASIRQFLARLRDLYVPRHIWVNQTGMECGYSSKIDEIISDLKAIISSTAAQLSVAHPMRFDIEAMQIFQAFLKFYAGYKARDHAERLNYRNCVIEELEKDNSTIIKLSTSSTKELKELLVEHRDTEQLKERELVLAAPLIDEKKADSIAAKSNPTPDELRQVKLFKLHNKYLLHPSEMSLDLLAFDHDDGYRKLKNRYLLTAATGEAQAQKNDLSIVNSIIRDEKTFLPDVVSKLQMQKISLLRTCRLPELMRVSTLQSSDTLCREVTLIAKNHIQELKRLFGISITDKTSVVITCNSLLELVGYTKADRKQVKSNGFKEWVYTMSDAAATVPVQKIFSRWDNKYLESIAKPIIKSDIQNLSTETAPTQSPLSSVTAQVGDAGITNTVDIITASNHNHYCTDKNGTQNPYIRSIDREIGSEINMKKVDYSIGLQVLYFSLQRGGCWVPAKITQIKSGGAVVIRCEDSSLNIICWHPESELVVIPAA
jgi:hypothetical protein